MDFVKFVSVGLETFMHRLTSFDEIQSKLLGCKHVCLLFDGTVQSIYLLHLICLQNIRVTALALDYGVADRDKIKVLAGQFPVAFELLDASDLYESSVVVPMIRASALCNDRQPLLRSMTESTTAQIMVNYALQAGADEYTHLRRCLRRVLAVLRSVRQDYAIVLWQGLVFGCYHRINS